MKILLVILHADATRGGAELYTITLFRKLREAGHDVKIAAATFEPSIDPTHRVQLVAIGATRYRRYISFLRSLDVHVAGRWFDVVHSMLPTPCDVYHPHAGVEAAGWANASIGHKLTNRRRRAFVQVERGLFQSARNPSGLPPLEGGIRGGVLGREDTIRSSIPPTLPSPSGGEGNAPTMLCLSNRARDEAAVIYPRSVDRMVTLYSAVDETRFVPTDVEPIAHRCLFVGQDFERKGLDIAIRAIAANAQATLRVIGKDDPARYLSLAKQLSVADRVTFAGPSSDVANELANAEVLLLPARREPFGMVVPEAMLMGVPPIVSANAGASKIVRDGIDGRIVAGEDPAAWSRAIDDVLANRARYSASCLSRRAELSYSHHLSTLLGIYERSVRERQR